MQAHVHTMLIGFIIQVKVNAVRASGNLLKILSSGGKLILATVKRKMFTVKIFLQSRDSTKLKHLKISLS